MPDLAKNEPCPHCGRYANRGVSIDAVIVKNGKILLIQRGVEPYKGYWGTPGGYVEWDESAEDTLRREVEEETGLTVTKVQLVGVYSQPDRHPKQTINLLYHAAVKDGEPTHGDDALAAQWFDLNDLPEKLAFDHRQNIADALRLK